MTTEGRPHSENATLRSRGALRPRFASRLSLLENRGRREGRESTDSHGPRAIRKHGEGTTGSAETPGLPCAMALRLIRALPRNRALLLLSPRDHLAQLGLSVGRPGPHDFDVRISAVRPHDQKSRASQSRPPHPRLTFRDDSAYPLCLEAGCADHASDLGSASSSFLKIRTTLLRHNGTTGNLRMARMRNLSVVQTRRVR